MSSTTTSLGVARDFLDRYSGEVPYFERVAGQLQKFLQQTLSDANIHPHLVSTRVKTIDSMRGKLLRKGYTNPKKQLTDRIGARVIVYYSNEVDRVATALRRNLEIREKDSADRRRTLGLREFGYRSYHLIGAVPPNLCAHPDFRDLKSQVFEIQIRSILEHVWAEIEHTVVYKSGAILPDGIKRRFASLAGVLELLEHEFGQTSNEAQSLVEAALQELQSAYSASIRLDVPRMLAFLELSHPEGLSFRNAHAKGDPFPPGIEQRLLLALKHINVGTTGSLNAALLDNVVRNKQKRYARREGIRESELSHLAVLAIVVGVKQRSMLGVFFPEFSGDPSLQAALAV